MKEISKDLVGEKFDAIDVKWNDFETRLYALAVGADPTEELEYVYEAKGPKVVPTFPVTKALNVMGVAFANVKINLMMVLHGEQAIEIHRPLPSKFDGQAIVEIDQVWDKGKAAVLGVTGVVSDDKGPLVTLSSTAFIRGAGGFGGERGPSSEETAIPTPEGEPTFTDSYTTQKNQAALYRLCGDPNPIHIDPQFAQMGGFDKPFLHGLCTYGIAGRHIAKWLGDGDRLTSMTGRFAERVQMEDTVTTKIWEQGEGEAIVEVYNQNGDVVLNQSKITYKPAE